MAMIRDTSKGSLAHAFMKHIKRPKVQMMGMLQTPPAPEKSMGKRAYADTKTMKMR